MLYVAKFSGIFILFAICFERLAGEINNADCSCGRNNYEQNRIVGGWDAEPHVFPWLVAVNRKGKLHCGGALINDRYVLTAGHCIRWAVKSTLTIVAAMHKRNSNEGTVLPIADTLLHKDFFSHQIYDENDIALIKLKSPVQFTDKISPICLPPTGTTHYDILGTIAGWGKVKPDGLPGIKLQEAIVRVLTPAECQKTSMNKYMHDSVICGYTNSSDACQGDSGGPLTFEWEPGKWKIIGIVSWGIGCGNNNLPGMYTKVTHYLDWIYQHTKDANYCNNE